MEHKYESYVTTFGKTLCAIYEWKQKNNFDWLEISIFFEIMIRLLLIGVTCDSHLQIWIISSIDIKILLFFSKYDDSHGCNYESNLTHYTNYESLVLLSIRVTGDSYVQSFFFSSTAMHNTDVF